MFVPSVAQLNDSPKDILQRVGSYIAANTKYQVVDKTDGHVITTFDTSSINDNAGVVREFNDWVYPNGVMLYGLSRAADVGFTEYQSYITNNFNFIFRHYSYFKKLWETTHSTSRMFCYRLYRMESLDDCGAMGNALIEAYKHTNNPQWKKTIDTIAWFISTQQTRLADGTLCRTGPHRMTIWGDDLYMSVPFLARMGTLTQDSAYYNDAIRQVLHFYRLLLQPELGIAHHGYYDDIKQPSIAYWGRVNGWMMVATAELLGQLPATYPKRDSVLSFFRAHIDGIQKLQDQQTGLWHQLLDKPDSYLETSCSAMFTYSIARGINEGWLDSSCIKIAKKGWRGVASRITTDGSIEGTCAGTWIEDTLPFYYQRPSPTNDLHGFGPVLLAASEILRMEQRTK
ncbi:MAG TPA: glycoside hydrolase family 88 protein [Bacteroidota bacterium]|nr:glycoside hydrolase family 88 protein [Bacteroidota bacterium]